MARHVAGTMLGGYLLLMVVVILYYYLVARVGGAFIESAFTGCALLLGLAAPLFAAASWLTEQLRAGPPQAHARSPPHPVSAHSCASRKVVTADSNSAGCSR